MIEGEVTVDREAVVRLTVIGANGIQHSVNFVLDTGFTGYISLSTDEIAALELQQAAPSEFRFASGQTLALATYRARVLWDDISLPVIVMPLNEAYLLGMHLLSGATVTIEATTKGSVAIEPNTVDPFESK